MNLIKILNPNKAKKLVLLGFKYTIENFEGKQVYCFVQSNKLTKILTQSFSKCDFYVDNLMRF